jgi:hypothetical protein
MTITNTQIIDQLKLASDGLLSFLNPQYPRYEIIFLRYTAVNSIGSETRTSGNFLYTVNPARTEEFA